LQTHVAFVRFLVHAWVFHDYVLEPDPRASWRCGESANGRLAHLPATLAVTFEVLFDLMAAEETDRLGWPL